MQDNNQTQDKTLMQGKPLMQKIGSPEQFIYRHVFTPRWRDNDQYGHLNNAVYYEYFDSIANLYLMEEAGLAPQTSDEIAYVVHSQCQYIAPVAYPAKIELGLAVKKLGNSSVTWLISMFDVIPGADIEKPELKAVGEFVHVFVNRLTGDKTAIPDTIRGKLIELLIA